MESKNHEVTQTGFDFAYITKHDYLDVLALLEENFYIDEPVNQALGTSADRVADLNTRYSDMLNRYQKSLCARRNSASNSNAKEICGVLIVHIHDINNPIPSFTPRSSITTNYLRFLEQAESKFNVFEHYSLTAFPELAILSVDTKSRGKGLAMELCQRAIVQLFAEGFPLIYAEFSNPVSRKIGEKLGFKEVARFFINEYKGLDGCCMLPNLDDSHFVSLMILEKSETQ